MADNTGIEWTDATWNVVTGCDRVSPGCDRCYIERTIPFRVEGRRFDGNGRMGVRLHPDRLNWPVRWRKPRMIFTPSLGDLFHTDVPDDFICRVFDVMAATPQHTYQVLTKRPKRMARLFGDDDSVWDRLGIAALPNVWLGTSIESDSYWFRAGLIREMDAAVRWLSLEPLLGPLPSLDLTGIDWVVVGGESGPGARPMHRDWVRDIRDRCLMLDIPFFFKQWGEWLPLAERVELDLGPANRQWSTVGGSPIDGGATVVRVGKKAAGRELDGRIWDEYPSLFDGADT